MDILSLQCDSAVSEKESYNNCQVSSYQQHYFRGVNIRRELEEINIFQHLNTDVSWNPIVIYPLNWNQSFGVNSLDIVKLSLSLNLQICLYL